MVNEAGGGDGDLGERVMARRPPHRTQARHNLAEGARHLPLRLVLEADIEERVRFVTSSSSTPDNPPPDGPGVLASPLQPRHHALTTGALTVRCQVVAASQTLSWFAFTLDGPELGSLVGRPEGAQTEGQKMLCASQVTPKADVDAAQINTGRLKLQEHLGGLRRDEKLHGWDLRDGERRSARGGAAGGCSGRYRY